MKIGAKTKKKIKTGLKKRDIKREIERGVTNYIAKGSSFIDQISDLKTIEEFNFLLNTTFKEGDQQGLKGDILEIFTNWIFNHANDVFDFCILNGVSRSILHNKGIDPNETDEDFILRKKILERFNIPDLDEGIDGYFLTKQGKVGAYQCKVRTVKKTLNINEDKLGTFFKLTSDTPHKLSDPTRKRKIQDKFDFVVVVSTAESIPNDYNNDDNIWILKEDLAKFISDFTETYGESPFVKFSLYLEKIFEKDLLKPCGEVYDLMPHQKIQKNGAYNHYIVEGNTLGIMISPTGTGKTRMIFEDIFEVFPTGVHILAAPWISLIYQNLEDFLKYAKARGKEFDAAISYSTSENDRSLHSNGICRLKTEEEVATWLFHRDPKKTSILFTTYASSDKLIGGANLLLSLKQDFSFSSLTCDESHRTVGQKDNLWTKLVIPSAIPVRYKMFATATIREIGDMRNSLLEHNIEAIGMDDKKFFGDIFYSLTFKDAIKQKLICDFQIVVATETPEAIASIKKKIHLNGEEITSDSLDSRQLIGLGITNQLMQAGEIKKAIFFSSDNTRSAKAFSGGQSLFAPSLMSKEDVLFTSSYESSRGNKIDTIKAFGNAEKSLLFNCQQIKEGIDVKSCDCIVFLDPKTSKIDITQAIGRALRIDLKNPNKVAKIVLPVVAEIDENDACIINQDSYRHLQDFLTSIVELDEEIRENFDLLIEEIKGSKKSRVQKKGKLRFSKFEIFDYKNLEKIRIRILKSTGDTLWYSTEKIHHEIRDDERITSFKIYDEFITKGQEFRPDYFMFKKYQNISGDNFYKKIGLKKFLGMEKAFKAKKILYSRIGEIIQECKDKGYSKYWASKQIHDLILPYFPYVIRKEGMEEKGKRKRNLIENTQYKLNQGKGFPLAKTPKNFLVGFERQSGNLYEGLIEFCTEEVFRFTLEKFSISTRNEYFDSYKENYSDFLKIGMPTPGAISSKSVFTEEFIDQVLPRERKYYKDSVSPDLLKKAYDRLKNSAENGNWKGSGGYKLAAQELNMPIESLKKLFKDAGFPEIKFLKYEVLDPNVIKEKLESGFYTYFKLANEFNCRPREILKAINKWEKLGIKINYVEEDNSVIFIHSCGKIVSQKNNSIQHSKKCGCTFQRK
jgi:superfamily II DNA or RNA helicase